MFTILSKLICSQSPSQINGKTKCTCSQLSNVTLFRQFRYLDLGVCIADEDAHHCICLDRATGKVSPWALYCKANLHQIAGLSDV